MSAARWRRAEKPALCGASLADLVGEFQRRLAAGRAPNAADRLRLRNLLLKEAGAVGYDQVQQEFSGLAPTLDWPAAATLKDFRHLFCTTLGNAAMPEAYRRYLMGHAPGRRPSWLTATSTNFAGITRKRSGEEFDAAD